MKKLLILSGKGGTGKTSIAAAFSNFSKSKIVADCDVDAPNLHILNKQSSEPLRYDFVGSKKASIDPNKCIGCKKCYEHCHFDAIKYQDGKCEINEYACEGCGLCHYLCPVEAISMNDDFAGIIDVYSGESPFVTAKLKMGRGNSGKLVSAVKKLATKEYSDQELMIIDGSPGIGCPVIASISAVDMVLIVVEPSHSGLSDLKRLVKSVKLQKVKIAICVNKYDINEKISDEVITYANEEALEFVGKVPYDKHVSKAINDGLSIADIDCQAKMAIYDIYLKVMDLIKDENLGGK